MNGKQIISFKSLTIIIFLLISLFSSAEKDPLHKRTFNVKFLEVKDGTLGKKAIMDKMSFKDGKLFSDFLYDKFTYKWIKYRINKDSIYMDSTDTEVRLLEVEATTTDEANTTINIAFTVIEWNIEGEVRITKNDKLKKYYEITGREKGGKPKKEKKKKKLVEVVDGEVPPEQNNQSPGEQKKE